MGGSQRGLSRNGYVGRRRHIRRALKRRRPPRGAAARRRSYCHGLAGNGLEPSRNGYGLAVPRPKGFFFRAATGAMDGVVGAGTVDMTGRARTTHMTNIDHPLILSIPLLPDGAEDARRPRVEQDVINLITSRIASTRKSK